MPRTARGGRPSVSRHRAQRRRSPAPEFEPRPAWRLVPHDAETVALHCERDAAYPRAQHQIVFNVECFGAAIAYRRRREPKSRGPGCSGTARLGQRLFTADGLHGPALASRALPIGRRLARNYRSRPRGAARPLGERARRVGFTADCRSRAAIPRRRQI